jgi:hypothetical protein
MELKGKLDFVVSLKAEEISNMTENSSNSVALYHLQKNLKRKLLNKLIYKFTPNLFEKKANEKSLTMIDKKSEELGKSGIPISISFKLIWFSMQ